MIWDITQTPSVLEHIPKFTMYEGPNKIDSFSHGKVNLRFFRKALLSSWQTELLFGL